MRKRYNSDIHSKLYTTQYMTSLVHMQPTYAVPPIGCITRRHLYPCKLMLITHSTVHLGKFLPSSKNILPHLKTGQITQENSLAYSEYPSFTINTPSIHLKDSMSSLDWVRRFLSVTKNFRFVYLKDSFGLLWDSSRIRHTFSPDQIIAGTNQSTNHKEQSNNPKESEQGLETTGKQLPVQPETDSPQGGY